MKHRSIKAISIALALLNQPALAMGDSCMQMLKSQWHGTYQWTYRGDSYQKPMVSSTQYLGPHSYLMRAQVNTSTGAELTLQGTCMNSQIYLEDKSLRFPIYLQGTIQNAEIELSGNRGPDVVLIRLKKDYSGHTDND